LDSLNNKKLTLESNEFVVSVNGQYNILQLPQSFQLFLNHYYPSYINPPKTELSNQNFVATISTGDFDKYAKLIDSNLSGFNNAFLSGKISTLNGNKFNLNVSIPSAKYKRDSIAEAKFTGIGDNDSLLLEGNIGRIYLSDSMYFPNTKISVHSANDLSHIKIATRANATLNDAELDADLQTMSDGLKINFHPSSFVLNDKKWNLENQGEVVIAKHSASAKNMKFTQGFQEISIESVNDTSSTSNTLAVRLKDVDFGDIMPLVVERPLMEGIANGDVYLRDIYTQFHADATLKLTQFRLNNDSIGVVNVGAKYNAGDGRIIYNVKANDENFVMNANGSYNTKDSTQNPLETSIALDHAKVGILNSFLGTLFDDITGFATGNLAIHGDLKSMSLTGKVHLDSGALTVKYTKVRYTIPSADFVLTEDAINLGTFTLKDKFGNTGNVKGTLYETAFKNNRYDLDMSTNKLLLFDTRAKDNDHFYGDVIGKATLSLKGPQENLQMNITGEAVETSHIYIPTDNSKKSADADYIYFKQYGIQVQPDVLVNTTNLNINLDLIATNKAVVSVILDELTGDIIEATGNGR
ncbi:MAG TPA: translocation/assembly module TamB domain-containing protein, partial [Parafilimonas sp.]